MLKKNALSEYHIPALNGGLNLRELPNEIGDNQSPDMLNMWYKDKMLSKRWGQQYVSFKNASGSGAALDGTIYAISPLFDGYVYIHAGTKLYQWNESKDELTVLTLPNGGTRQKTESCFFLFADALYHLDGAKIIKIALDPGSTTARKYACFELSPYTPTVFINCKPDLSDSTPNENVNLLSPYIKFKYNGNKGGNVWYYVLSTPTNNTFTVGKTLTAAAAVNVNTSGSTFNVQVYGASSWKSVKATVANNTFTTTEAHGFQISDIVLFQAGTGGSLPSGISAYDSDAVKEYQVLSTFKPFNDTYVSVTVDGDEVKETELVNGVTVRNYSWDSSTCKVAFTKAPPTGTNNVEITVKRTDSTKLTANLNCIMNCTFGIPFGGESSDIGGGSRAFLMGNTNYPRRYWYSDLGAAGSNGMDYFPELQYEELNQNNDPIKTAAKQAGSLIIFKEHSLFSVTYEFDGESVYYPVREFNSTLGCDMPGSVQLIDNNLVFANTYGGVFMIVNTSNTAEENVRSISGNINGTRFNLGLSNETSADKTKATSIDYARKYWLCIGKTVYLWDYDLYPFYGYSTQYTANEKNLVWFKFYNINAKYWYGGESLYYANDNASNQVVRFIEDFMDFDKAINAYWYSKAFDLGMPNYLKTITRIYPMIAARTNSAIDIVVANEENEAFYTNPFVETAFFDLSEFDLSIFALAINRYSECLPQKVKMKKVKYFQLKLSNNYTHRNMGISDLTIEFFVNGKVKR